MAKEKTDTVPTCQVCGEPLREGSVACVVCGTGHHAECFNYNEGCSVYGCDGKEAYSCDLEEIVTNGSLIISDSDALETLDFTPEAKSNNALIIPKIDPDTVPVIYELPNKWWLHVRFFFKMIKWWWNRPGSFFNSPTDSYEYTEKLTRKALQKIDEVVRAGEGDLEMALQEYFYHNGPNCLSFPTSTINRLRTKYVDNKKRRLTAEYHERIKAVKEAVLAVANCDKPFEFDKAFTDINDKAGPVGLSAFEMIPSLRDIYVETRYKKQVELLNKTVKLTENHFSVISFGVPHHTFYGVMGCQVDEVLSENNAKVDDNASFKGWVRRIFIPRIISNYVRDKADKLYTKIKDGNIKPSQAHKELSSLTYAAAMADHEKSIGLVKYVSQKKQQILNIIDKKYEISSSEEKDEGGKNE